MQTSNLKLPNKINIYGQFCLVVRSFHCNCAEYTIFLSSFHIEYMERFMSCIQILIFVHFPLTNRRELNTSRKNWSAMMPIQIP